MQDRITIRMSPDLMQRLDQWIATQPGFVSRQEAIRQLAAAALDQQTAQDALCTSVSLEPNNPTLIVNQAIKNSIDKN